MHIARISNPNLENLDEIFGIPAETAAQWRARRASVIYKALFQPDSPILSDADALEEFIRQMPDSTTPQQGIIAAFIFSKNLTLETQRIRSLQLQEDLKQQIIDAQKK